MCFSAGASFGASAILLVGGLAAIRKVRNPSQIMFASIPLLFSFQQFTEGFVWLSFKNPAYAFLHYIPSDIFLFIALVLWPLWLPLSVLKLEKDIRRKKILYVLTVIGILTSAYLAYSLVFDGYETSIMSNHVMYKQAGAIVTYVPFSGLLYFLPLVIIPFVSSVKRMNYFGFAILITYFTSNLFYRGYVISVWCYFAAIISVTIYFLMDGLYMQVSTKKIETLNLNH